MPSFSSFQALGRILDEHIVWFVQWQKLAFFPLHGRAEKAQALTPPPGFALWLSEGGAGEPQHQPAIDRLASLHDQLHQLARLILIKTPEDQALAHADFEAISHRFVNFVQEVRNVEQAYAAADSGLDPLTGLCSRARMMEDLSREISRFQRTGKPFCIVAIDIDHFKAVNDTYGHDGGDRVLVAVGDLISRDLRVFDDAYRYGGEEFIVCLKETDAVAAFAVAERLRTHMQKSRIVLADGRETAVTASLGLAAAWYDAKPEDLLRAADDALYQAKEQGRNRVIVAGLDKPKA